MAEHPFAVTRDRYDEAMALARQMATERDERFEQLKKAEAERDRLRRLVTQAVKEFRGHDDRYSHQEVRDRVDDFIAAATALDDKLGDNNAGT